MEPRRSLTLSSPSVEPSSCRQEHRTSRAYRRLRTQCGQTTPSSPPAPGRISMPPSTRQCPSAWSYRSTRSSVPYQRPSGSGIRTSGAASALRVSRRGITCCRSCRRRAPGLASRPDRSCCRLGRGCRSARCRPHGQHRDPLGRATPRSLTVLPIRQGCRRGRMAEFPNIPGQSHRFDYLEPALRATTREAVIGDCRVRVVPLRDVLRAATEAIVSDAGGSSATITNVDAALRAASVNRSSIASHGPELPASHLSTPAAVEHSGR